MASNTEVAKAIIDVDGKEAEQKLKGLSDRAKELRQLMKDAKSQGDNVSYQKLKKELGGVTNATDKLRRSNFDLKKVLDDLSGSSVKALERAHKQLTNEIRNGNRATEQERAELQKKAAQLEKVDAELANVRREMNLTKVTSQTMASQFANAMNKYFLAATAAIASFASLIMGVKKAISTFAEWDDKLADVQKTTTLSRDQVVDLNEEFRKIDTRSAQLELLDLARVAGKLGLSTEKDVEGFVKAADKIKVALSEDLGGDVEESINAVGKLVDIFKVKQEFGIEEGMLKTGSAINALGAASTANEAYLVEFTKRVAGVAPTAGISIDKILGLGATLDQLGQQSEVASTVFSQIIPDMFRNTATYAEVAGMSVSDFSDLLKKDANEALIRMLEGLNGNNAGMEHMVKVMDDLGIEGKRSISVLGVLANNVDILRESQALSNEEFRKGTSLTEEFNTKNNTMQARLEKARKSLYNVSVELGENLAPAMTFSTNSMTYMIKVLNWLVNAFTDYRHIIIPAALAIGVYTVAVKASVIWTKLFDAALKIATTTMKIFNATTKMNPLAALAAGVVALISAFTLYNRHVDDAAAKLKKLNKETNTAVGESNALFEQLKRTTAGTRERQEAIWRLRDVHGAYIDDLNLEKASLQKIEAAQKGANDELVRKIALESQTKDLSVWFTKELEIKKRIAALGFDVEKIMNERANPQRNSAGNIIFTTYGNEVDNLLMNLTVVEGEVEKIYKLYENIMKNLSARLSGTGSAGSGGDGDGGGEPDPDPKELLTEYELLGKKIEEAKKQLQDFVMAGNMEEAMKVGVVIKQLEEAKKWIDELIAAYGDVDLAIANARKNNPDLINTLTPLTYTPGQPIPKKRTGSSPTETSATGFGAMDKDEKGDWAIEQAETASNAVFDIWRNSSNARFDHEMSLLDAQMEKELSNKKLTEEQKDKIREKYAAKERKLKQEQFRKQKTADIIQSIINTALAVVKALPDPALALAAGIAGAAQTAVIASQKIPAFYGGGDTGPGLGVRDDKGTVAGVVHANEYVVPEWMRKMPVVIAFERVMEGIRTGKHGYSQGGSTPAPSGSGSTPPAVIEKGDLGLKSAIDRLNMNIEKGIRAKMIYQDFERFEEKVNSVEKSAGF